MTPLVGLPCCLRTLGEQPFHVVSDKYVAAAVDGAGVLPVLLPAIGGAMSDMLERLDGLFLTGSPSNIEPRHYAGPAAPADNLIDPARDATTLTLIRAALAIGLPILAVCRGLQELNVALGGTLHQEIHRLPDRMDHRSAHDGPPFHRYRKVHMVSLTEGGACAALAGGTELLVNSLHAQGIDRLAPALSVEAVAPDGQIEAVRLDGVDFVLGVQWHPEWSLGQDGFSNRLFAAFGAACRGYAKTRVA